MKLKGLMASQAWNALLTIARWRFGVKLPFAKLKNLYVRYVLFHLWPEKEKCLLTLPEICRETIMVKLVHVLYDVRVLRQIQFTKWLGHYLALQPLLKWPFPISLLKQVWAIVTLMYVNMKSYPDGGFVLWIASQSRRTLQQQYINPFPSKRFPIDE